MADIDGLPVMLYTVYNIPVGSACGVGKIPAVETIVPAAPRFIDLQNRREKP
jgi:hypothetical protein